tara:strand:- start:2633 stop:4105 length:1473 start_codon:yes stop_codon:yes gene_type:complete
MASARSSQVAAKNFQIRAENFSSSSAAVTFKSYDDTSVYDLYTPAKNPKYINGVDGTENHEDQVYTYDVATDMYVWKSSAPKELFIQGQDSTTNKDERGNVLTIEKEERVQPGDPLFDPAKPMNQQEFKVKMKFTDELFNMTHLTAGKKEIIIPYKHDVKLIEVNGNVVTLNLEDGVLIGTKLEAGSSVVTLKGMNGASAYEQTFTVTEKVDDEDNHTSFIKISSTDAATIQTLENATVSYVVTEGADNIDKTTGLYFDYKGSAPAGLSRDETKQLTDKIVLQTLEIADSNFTHMMMEPEAMSLTTQVKNHPNNGSTLKLHQYKQDISFKKSNKHFNIDSTVDEIDTNMNCIVFGDEHEHRLKICNGKLYIQKYNGNTWVGADVVVDQIYEHSVVVGDFQMIVEAGAIKITSIEFRDTDGVTVPYLSDGGKYKVAIDDKDPIESDHDPTVDNPLFDPEGPQYPGEHTVVIFAVDADGNRISDYSKQTITV